MTYKIITTEDPPFIFDELFDNAQGALDYLEDNAQVGQEYQVVEIAKVVKYEMKKVLVPLEERDTITTYGSMMKNELTNDQEEETMPFEVALE